MKVSTKGRYGIRALVDLAVHSTESHVSLVSIAERQKISLNYLEQVFATLRKAGIVKSIKGSQGGYVLAKNSREITIAEVLSVLEGDFRIVDDNLFSDGEVDLIRSAIQTLLWDKINTNVNDFLTSISIEDLADEYRRLNNEFPEMYYI